MEKVDLSTRKTSLILVNENKIYETTEMDEEPTLNHRKTSTNSASPIIDKTNDASMRRKGKNKDCYMNANKW